MFNPFNNFYSTPQRPTYNSSYDPQRSASQFLTPGFDDDYGYEDHPYAPNYGYGYGNGPSLTPRQRAYLEARRREEQEQERLREEQRQRELLRQEMLEQRKREMREREHLDNFYRGFGRPIDVPMRSGAVDPDESEAGVRAHPHNAHNRRNRSHAARGRSHPNNNATRERSTTRSPTHYTVPISSPPHSSSPPTHVKPSSPPHSSSPPKHHTPSPSASPASSPAQTRLPTPTPENQAAASKIQRVYRTHASVRAISSLDARFDDLKREYASKFGSEDSDAPRPRKVDFSVKQPGQEGEGMTVSVDVSSLPLTPIAARPLVSVSVSLAYTPTNTPLLAYIEALNQLLVKLDEVESYGVKEIRTKRKEVVRRIEKELGGVGEDEGNSTGEHGEGREGNREGIEGWWRGIWARYCAAINGVSTTSTAPPEPAAVRDDVTVSSSSDDVKMVEDSTIIPESIDPPQVDNATPANAEPLPVPMDVDISASSVPQPEKSPSPPIDKIDSSPSSSSPTPSPAPGNADESSTESNTPLTSPSPAPPAVVAPLGETELLEKPEPLPQPVDVVML